MKKTLKDNIDEKSAIDKNLKMMSISAVVLIALFFYTLIKSDNIIYGTSYYVGIGFLFVLLFLTLALQKFKDKIRAKIPKNKFSNNFSENLSQAQEKQDMQSTQTNLAIENEKDNTANLDIEPVKSNISFKDIAGIDSVKEQLLEIVDFLNNPKKYTKHGVSLPKGVLLVGPPGVGKTMIAKAVASEAGVPFYYQSGASFVNIYVGAGAKKVRELFTVARASAPSIIFIDEIDAIGKQRGIGSNDEREATLNELLTQMDGFLTNQNQGVMVIAATNKIEVLDDALLRAGRFDRRVFLDLPNKDDRKKILELYLKTTRHNFDIDKLSSDTSGFSSAALSTLINEALLCMIKRDGTSLLEDDIEVSKNNIQFGTKQLQILNDDKKEILAIYQAGKAFFTKQKTKLFENSIDCTPLTFASKTKLKDQIKKYLAGSIALEVLKNEQYIVKVDEIKYSYELATKLVKEYKMENSIDDVISNLKSDLTSHFTLHKDELNILKDKLLQDEEISTL